MTDAAAKPLNPRQRRFVTAYMASGKAVDAAIEAGYAAKSARHTAYALLHQTPAVIDEVARLKKFAAAESELTAVRALELVTEDIEQAKRANQFSAAAKFRELQFKVAGVIEEKLRVSVEYPDISCALAEARARTVARPICDLPEPIEGKFQALPSSAGARSVDCESIGPFGDDH